MSQRGLACPARFERATYALEAQKIDNFDSILNLLDLAKSGVVLAVYLLASNGIECGSYGINI